MFSDLPEVFVVTRTTPLPETLLSTSTSSHASGLDFGASDSYLNPTVTTCTPVPREADSSGPKQESDPCNEKVVLRLGPETSAPTPRKVRIVVTPLTPVRTLPKVPSPKRGPRLTNNPPIIPLFLNSFDLQFPSIQVGLVSICFPLFHRERGVDGKGVRVLRSRGLRDLNVMCHRLPNGKPSEVPFFRVGTEPR